MQGIAPQTSARAPALFIGHGSPLLAVDAERAAAVVALGKRLPKPRAAIVVSAHWEQSPLTAGATSHTQVIYDFGGFPRELYQIHYNPPGAEWLLGDVQALLDNSVHPQPTRSTRGLDHGVWTPLMHLWPDAGVPVLQLSMPRDWSDTQVFQLGRALAPLRDRNIMLIGSGNLTHDLGSVDWRAPLTDAPTGTPDQIASVAAFEQWALTAIESRDWDSLTNARISAPDYRGVHPTDEHWRPLLFASGAAIGTDSVSYPVTGWEHGILSRRAILWE
jgi:4,5-DOPA dioxygenase extradiol